MLEKRLAGEMLVVGVLDPPRDDRLVGQLVGVLQIQQPRHQPRRRGRTAGAGWKEPGPFPLEELPVDQGRQLRQFVAHVDHVGQTRAKQIVLLCLVGMGLHRGSEIRKVSETRIRNPAIPHQCFSMISA